MSIKFFPQPEITPESISLKIKTNINMISPRVSPSPQVRVSESEPESTGKKMKAKCDRPKAKDREGYGSFFFFTFFSYRQWPNSIVAIFAGIIVRKFKRALYNLGRNERGISISRSGRGRPTMGRTKIEAEHELR